MKRRKNMGKKPSKKEAILNSAYELLSKKGIRDVTIKDIAEQANVNIAAINYYFGSKENLVDMVIEKYIKEAFELFSIFEDTKESLEQRLKNFSQKSMEIACSSFHRAILFQAIGEDSIIPRIQLSFKTHMEAAMNIISKIEGKHDEQEIILKTVLFYSCLYFPMLVTHYNATILDFYKPEVREKYIALIMDGFFKNHSLKKITTY
jgi:TetR/AcrR family transcriptional regulator, regulator of cefoperazone and chloramphenicol sensitivity